MTIAIAVAAGILAISQPADAAYLDAMYDWLCSMGITYFCSTPVKADCGSLTAVSDFGGNPGKLQMCTYVPSGLPAGRPLVIALHGCEQQAKDYGYGAGWTKLADEYRFALLLPQQTQANNPMKCFSWFQPKDEAASIRAMVQMMQDDYKVDAKELYVTGLSAGGAMTAALLADYPEVKGGGIVAGIPFGCANDPIISASTCMNPGVDKTPQEWGDLVRAAAPGHIAGQGRPKVSVWQGAADNTVKPKNADDLVDQWTNVLGIDQTPDKTATVLGADYKGYADANGTILVEKYLVPATDHGVEVDPAHGCGIAGPWILDNGICSSRLIVNFWGLSPN